ncbi:MAG: amino acid adenylation domain-containing protein [Balneolales bacterium]|nr:amino acid adenylation domain-containing protein [Balneolales bacterium]
MSSVQVKNICGLSPVQEGMYFHYLMARPNDPYVIQSQYELEGFVDSERLKVAFDVLVDRHDSLRTLFMHQKTPDPVQIVLNKRETPFEFHDLSGQDEPEACIGDYTISDIKKGFDLSKDPLIRLALFQIGDESFRLVMTLHHIILDGWSSGVIENELFRIYAGNAFAADVVKRSPVSFAGYIKWLKSQPENEGIEYFKKIIPVDVNVNPFTRDNKSDVNSNLLKEDDKSDANANPFTEDNKVDVSTNPLSQDDKSVDNPTPGVHKSITNIDFETTRQLKTLASEQQVTLSDLLRAAWYLCTCKLTGSDRFTTLHTVSGRPAELPGSSEMVGMFINAMVQPVTISDQSILEFLRQHHQQFAQSLTWQHVSMSKVAKSVGVQSELADSLLVFENYPELGDERASLEAAMGFTFKSLSSDETTNYPVTIQFHIGDTIEVRYFLKENWFNTADLQRFEKAFDEVLREIVRDPFQSVMTFLPKQSQKLPAEELSVYISSNFTDTSIEPYLNWWLESAGFSPEIKLADYNSVIQETMDSESLIFTHSGPSLILLKVLDLARFRPDLSGESLEKFLIDTISVITSNLKKHPGAYPLCIALTPEQPELIDNVSAARYERVISHLQTEISGSDHIKMIDLRQSHLSNADVFDATSNQIGHIPYTEAGYSYLASQLARTLRAWKHQPFKVIVLDADNTLWQGVLGEDGVDGVQITEAHKLLQNFMLERRNEGFLLALCTKNNNVDVEEFFASRADMVLKSSDFVSIKANWAPKSGNIRELAQELNLGLDSFIFLDDSSLEIEEVSSELPDVLALKLPEQTSQWKLFLGHVWAFDTFNVTKEDRNRTELYQAETKRREIALKHDQPDDFIAQLNVKTEFIHAQEAFLPRIEQLTQRTNQFNLNGRRFTLAEVISYGEQAGQQVIAMSVSDQFGEYGLTGALFIRIDENILHVDAWMLSCRVLSRGVEHHVIRFLSTIASRNGADIIRFHHVKTPKNVPVQLFLLGELFELASNADADIDFVCENVKKVPDVGSFALVESLQQSHQPQNPQINRQVAPSFEKIDRADEVAYDHLPETSGAAFQHIRNKRYLAAIHKLHPQKLQNCRKAINNAIYTHLTAYMEPITQSEHQIAAIWSDLLDVTQVGRNDDFFHLGGNSLMATRLASRLYKTFGIDINLKSVFENSVLNALAAVIDYMDIASTKASVEEIMVIESDSYSLSDSQLRIWRSEQVFDTSAGYILGGAYRIGGDFDIDRLRMAIQRLTNRHSALRTTFPQINGEPRQVIHDAVSVPVLSFETSGTPDDLSQKIEAFFTTRFDLENGPLLAFAYHQNSSDDHILAIKIHHLVTDGWSQGIVMKQLLELYQNGSDAQAKAEAPTVRFVDFVHWQQNQADSQHADWKKFWEMELSDEYERFEFPADYPRPKTIKKSTQQLSISVDADFRSKVDAFSRRNQLSLYMTMMASVHLLVQKYTGSADNVIGSPFSGRTHPSVQDTVGFFVNTLPFRMKSQSEQSLSAWLNEIREKTIHMLQYQHVSLDTILSHMQITATDGRPPLFDVLVLVQEEPESDGSDGSSESGESDEAGSQSDGSGDSGVPKSTGLSIKPFSSEHMGAGYDLVFQVFSSRNAWRLVIEYQPELFHPRTITALGEHWKAVLKNMTEADDRALVSEISANTLEINNTLKRLGRGAKRDYPDQTLLEVFESVALRNPTSIALIDEKNRDTTYHELDLLSTSVARKLINRGVRPGDRIIVNTELKSHAILLMLALFKCRAIYVPVDSETPAPRLEYIMETCNPVYRIIDFLDASAITETSEPFETTDSLESPKIPETETSVEFEKSEPIESPEKAPSEQTHVLVLLVQQLLDEPTPDPVDLPERGEPGDSAYIIFTSGSTGRPKGVEVHHRGLVNMTHTTCRNCDVNASDRVICFASISFDASLSEFYMGFLPGATLICPENSIKKDAFEFVDFMNRQKISVITIPPVFLASLNRPELPHLKSILTAGEAARKSDALHYAKTKRYINAYGPTECSVGSNAHIVQADGNYSSQIPIGTAFDNVQLAVLDKNLELAPFGATGQLAINGIQVAKGYYGRPDLTEKVFIRHPEFEGRTYLTGDLVRWNAQGQLEFIGRNDNQVKVRGYRIELDEIKQQLELISDVSISHIQVVTDSHGEKQIIAWLVEVNPINDEDLRRALLRHLPNYMIPARFIRVPEIKLTINGKVDVKSLPNPFEQGSRQQISTYSGDNPELKLLHEALGNYLTGTIDITASFTQVGGDSIKAIQITNFLKQHGYPIRAGLLYEVSRLDELSEHMTKVKSQLSGKPALKPGIVRCTPMQQWFFREVTEPDQQNLFWMQAGFTVHQVLPSDFIIQMLRELVSHHEIFRIRFNNNDTANDIIEAEPIVDIQLLDGDSADFTTQLDKYHQSLNRIIDFEQGSVAAFLVVQKRGSTQILCTVHHLVIDAMSLRLIRDQFQWMLNQFEKRESFSLETGYITQQQWTDRCQEIANDPGFGSEREYWKSIYTQKSSQFVMFGSGIKPTSTHSPETKPAFNPPETQVTDTYSLGKKPTDTKPRVQSTSLSRNHSGRLLDLCKTSSQKPEHVLLAACVKAIAAITGKATLSVDIESQGRESLGKSVDTGTTLGWFTTEYPIRLSSDNDLLDIISDVATSTNRVQNDGLGAILVRNELFESGIQPQKADLGFNYLGKFDSNDGAQNEWQWDDSLILNHNGFSHKWHPLELSALIENGSIQLRLQSNTPSIDQDELVEILRLAHDSLVTMASSVEKDTRPVIVFFPFVASNALYFENLKSQLEPEFNVVVLELPGHGKRIDEPFAESIEVACNDLLRQIGAQDEPMFWVGHSMGAYLGSACLQYLAAWQMPHPAGFLISDVAAPGQFDAWIVGEMTHAQRHEYYARLGYDVLLNELDAASKAHAEQLIHQDLKLIRQFVNPNQPQITVPVHFLYSKSESKSVKNEWIQGWQAICEHKIECSAFDGGHIDWLEKTHNSDVIKEWIFQFSQPEI